jgi:TolB-like protein/Tfp pilus assembly protein PilF
MSGIIENYTYDIFISYRQKDNKYDGWVTEFVDNLKRELEATFKEEISVYFDINPNDGLLETHDVDESLKEKLKCLIFIPIISRTYCDSKSFAWEHEFKAFMELASKDQLGLKVKLPNGNVANRVLPIRIYDLDPDDIQLCESVMGGALRGIEFIYKSPGVNRPLRANEDHPHDNLNKTYYRDQINKVANSIKEVITAIIRKEQPGKKAEVRVTGKISLTDKNKNTGIISGSALVLVLLILGLLFGQKIIKQAEQPEKSIAVLPFINDSPDQENTYFINGIMDEILNNLQKIRDFRVLSRTSTEQYRGSARPPIPKIGKALNVNYIVEGSGQKYGNRFILRVQLIAATKERHLWAKSYDREIRQTSDIINIQSEIARSIAKELETTITPEEKKLIENIPTDNLEAYDYYLLGEYLSNQRTPENLLKAKDYFEKAIEADPGFTRAYTDLAGVYGLLAFYANILPEEAYSTSLELARKALELDSLCAEAYVRIGIVDAFYNFDFVSAEKNYKRALEIDPNNLDTYKSISELLCFQGKFSEALDFDNRAKAIDPTYPVRDGLYAAHLYFAGQKDSSIAQLTKLIEQYPVCNYYLGLIYLNEREYYKAIEKLKKTSSEFSPISITCLGLAYSKSGALNETRRILDNLEARAKTEFVPYSMRGALLAELGRKEEALDYFKKGYELREEFILVLMHIDTILYSNVRSDPGFIEVIRKIKE